MSMTVARIFELTMNRPARGALSQAVRGLVACLPVTELAHGVTDLLEVEPTLSMMLQRRLVHLHETNALRNYPDTLAAALLEYDSERAPVRRRVSGKLLALYHGFRPQVRRRILQQWWDDGLRDAYYTVIRRERAVFPYAQLLEAWRDGDAAAAIELAWGAPPARLGELLPELLGARPWMVRMAGARAKRIAATTWKLIRQRLPGSYIHLCARRGRSLSDAKAWRLLEASYAHADLEESEVALRALGYLQRAELLERATVEADRLAALRPPGATYLTPSRSLRRVARPVTRDGGTPLRC